MRHFAEELRQARREVHYYAMEEDFSTGLAKFVRQTKLDTLFVMESNDHDRAQAMPAIAKKNRLFD